MGREYRPGALGVEQGLAPGQLTETGSEPSLGMGRGPRLGHLDPVPYGTGPLIATFATLLLYGSWIVPRKCLSLGGTNEWAAGVCCCHGYMSTGLSSESPMVSYQGFIWLLLDCATHSPCYILNAASPFGG